RGGARRAGDRGVPQAAGARGGRGGDRRREGGVMRWDQPWLLLALLVIPWILWRRRREVARTASVLWVRVGSAWSDSAAAFGLKAVGLLPWVALVIAVLAL